MPNLDNVKLRRVNQLEALHRISLAMSATLSVNSILEIILNEVMTFTNAGTATVYILDEDSGLLTPRLSKGEQILPSTLNIQTDNDLAIEVIKTAKTQQATCDQLGCVLTYLETTDNVGTCCRICIPLVANDTALGVIDLKTPGIDHVDPEVQNFLSTLASQAAMVIRNASIHEELEHHYRELTLLYDIQREVSSTLDYRKVLDLITDRTKHLMDASECTIRLLEEKKGKRFIRVAATTGHKFIGPEIRLLDQSQIDSQVFDGEMMYISDVRVDPRFSSRGEAVDLGIVSMLCAPLIARGKILGTIRLYTSEKRDFDISERKMYLSIAGQAATAIENAILYSQVEEANKELIASNSALKKTQKELVKKEKLAALGEMAATVAHEIRNPLTSVRGFAQRIARKYSNLGDSRLGEYTEIIIEEVDRLNKFIKDVLDFARRAKPDFQYVNLNILLSEILNLMRDELTEQSIVVVPDLDMKLKNIVADETLLKQVFLNILQNSRQAMKQGGILMIRTQNSPNEVRLRIADDGSGISREILQRIWTPFYTTKVQGTGLGLALVMRIIDDHHGRVTIRSRPGKGTIVDIHFPVISDPEELLIRTPNNKPNIIIS